MNIFIAKLSSNTSSEDLQELFGQYGSVANAKVIFDRETGFSKRYGFVEMDDDNEGRSAIDALNETEFDGATIVVKEARPREERSGGGGGGRGGFGGGNRGGGGGSRGGYGQRDNNFRPRSSDDSGDRRKRDGGGSGFGNRGSREGGYSDSWS